MSEKIFVPPIKIQGIKTKLVPLIRNNTVMDSTSVWIEPFMGSGVVGFNVEPQQAIFADINPYIIDFYNQIKAGVISPWVVRNHLEREGKLLELGDDKYYYAVRTRFNEEHNPLDFLFLNRCCFNGMIRFNKNFEFNVPYGHKPQRFSKAYITKIVNQVTHVTNLLNSYSWEFLCQPFEKTISLARANDFIYCDPPYIGRHVDYYDSWEEQSEIALHDALMESGAKFMLSTWDHNDFRQNDYIRTIWNDCQKLTKDHYYHVGAKEANRNPIVEALLTNYSATNQHAPHLSSNTQICLFDTEEIS